MHAVPAIQPTTRADRAALPASPTGAPAPPPRAPACRAEAQAGLQRDRAVWHAQRRPQRRRLGVRRVGHRRQQLRRAAAVQGGTGAGAGGARCAALCYGFRTIDGPPWVSEHAVPSDPQPCSTPTPHLPRAPSPLHARSAATCACPRRRRATPPKRGSSCWGRAPFTCTWQRSTPWCTCDIRLFFIGAVVAHARAALGPHIFFTHFHTLSSTRVLINHQHC